MTTAVPCWIGGFSDNAISAPGFGRGVAVKPQRPAGVRRSSNSHFGRGAERLASFRSRCYPVQQLRFVLPIPTIRKLRAAIIMRIAGTPGSDLVTERVQC